MVSLLGEGSESGKEKSAFSKCNLLYCSFNFQGFYTDLEAPSLSPNPGLGGLAPPSGMCGT